MFAFAALFQIKVKSELLENRYFVGFYKFYPIAIGVFDVGKTARSLAHIERIIGIYGERATEFNTTRFERVHTLHIETKVNETPIAPKTVFKYLSHACLAIQLD